MEGVRWRGFGGGGSLEVVRWRGFAAAVKKKERKEFRAKKRTSRTAFNVKSAPGLVKVRFTGEKVLGRGSGEARSI